MRLRGICHFRPKILRDVRDSSLACSARCASPWLGMTMGWRDLKIVATYALSRFGWRL